MGARTVIRIVLGMIAAGVLALAVLGAGALYLTTEAGRGRIGAWLRGGIGAGDARVAVASLEALGWRTISLAGVTVGGTDPWLRVERLQIHWRPEALLSSRLHLVAVEGEGLTLERWPEAAAAGGAVRLPLTLAVDDARIAPLVLGPRLVGDAVSLLATGGFHAGRDGSLDAHVVLRREAAAGQLDLTVRVDPAGNRLRVESRLREGVDSVLGRLLGRPDLPPLAADGLVEGALSDWRGQWRVDAGDALAATVDIAGQGTDSLTADLQARAGGTLLSPALRDALGGDVSLRGRLAWHGGRTVRVERLELVAPAAVATLAGEIDPDRLAIAADARLVDVPGATTLAPGIAVGGLDLTARVAGSPAAPTVDATLRARDVATPIGVAATALLAANGRLMRDTGGAGLRFSLRADADGVQADAALRPLVGSSLHLMVAEGVIRFAPATLEATGVAVRAGGLGLDADLRAALAEGAANATFAVALADIGQLAPGLGGALNLEGFAQTEDGGVRVTLGGDVRDLKTGDATLDRLMGSRVPFALEAIAGSDLSVRLIEATLSVAVAHMRAEGALAPGASDVAGRLVAELPDLGQVARTLGVDAAGKARIELDIAGPPGAPTARGAGVLEGFSVAGRDLGRVALDVDSGRLLPAPAGRFAARLDGPAGSARAAAKIAYDPARRELALTAASFAGLGVSGEGDLRIALDRRTLAGSLAVRAANIGPLAALAGLDAAGPAAADLRLSADGATQTVDLEAGSDRLRLGPLTVNGAAVRGRAQGPWDALAGQVQVDVATAAADGAALERLQLSAAGVPAAFSVSLAGKGSWAGRRLALSAAGNGARSAAGLAVTFDRLEGAIDDRRVAARAPLALRLGDTLGVDLPDLAVGEGRLALSAERRGAAVSGRANGAGIDPGVLWRDLPPELAAARLTFDADLAGTVTQPALAAHLRLDGARLGPAAATPPVGMVATASLRESRLAVSAEASGIGLAPLRLRLDAPLVLSLVPFALAVPPDAPLAGALDWSGAVGPLWESFVSADHRLEGDATLALTLGGTPGAPRLGGSAHLAGGRFEHLVTGTLVTGLDVTLAPDAGGSRLVLSGTGQDGQAGTFDMQGWIAPEAGLPRAAIDVTMRDATLIRRDELTATGSGALQLTLGAEGAGRLTGRIETREIEVTPIDRLPPDIPVLAIAHEKGHPKGGRSLSRRPSTPAPPLALDLRVDMPGRVFVRRVGLDSEWAGALVVGGTTVEPQVNGRLTAVRGEIALLGKDFVLRDSSVRFTGPVRAPILDIRAEHTGRDIAAVLRVAGTPDHPAVTLTSRPPLPQDEVLSRVLFAKDRATLSPFEAAQLADAVGSLSGLFGGSGGVLAAVRGGLGLDRLRVESSGEGVGDVRLAAGKYLAPNTYVGVKQGASPGSSAATVEVTVTPSVTVETEVGGTGGASVGLNWKYDY